MSRPRVLLCRRLAYARSVQSKLVWLLAFVIGMSAGCAGGARLSVPRAQAPQPEMSAQELFEAGRFQDALARASAGAPAATPPRDVFFAAQAAVRLGRIDVAQELFGRLAGVDQAWQATARLATALAAGDADALAAARAQAEQYPAHAYAQYELGLAHLSRDAFADAAQALDRSVAANARLAHAYYYAGLACQRLDRADLMAIRFEAFLRLAPQAPERAEVQSVMRTIRGQ